MSTALTRYTVLLSAPTDAKAECKAADDELQEINRTHSTEMGVEFYPTDWRRDARADSGDEPQKLLNRQIVEDADIILAIFKGRFGTPTSDYGSGTEEEIMLGLEMGKHVLVYFWEPDAGFAPADPAQYEKIGELKHRLGDKTVYQTYGDIEHLRRQITHDFTKLLFELEGRSISSKPRLVLAGIAEDDEIIQDSVSVAGSIVSSRLDPAAYDESVRSAYESVHAVKLSRWQAAERYAEEHDMLATASISPVLSEQLKGLSEQLTPRASIFSLKPVEVPPATRELVDAELNSLGLEATDDLFDLGRLRRNERHMPIGIDYSEMMLLGTDGEKEKYKALKTLIHECELRRDYAAFINANKHIGAVSIAITNGGGSPAHHVNVDIEVPKAACVQPQDLVAPSDHLMAYGIGTQKKCESFIKGLFGLSESVNFKSYQESCVPAESGLRNPPELASSPASPLHGPRRLESADFGKLMDYEFGDFKFIPNAKADTVVVRLSFDSLQQGRSYAFPARILLRDVEVSSLRYWITADELDKTVEGELAVIR